jgi:hypothetical protein
MRKQKRMPEAQVPEVNIACPNQKATHCQISHFGNLALKRIERAIHWKGLKPKLPK